MFWLTFVISSDARFWGRSFQVRPETFWPFGIGAVVAVMESSVVLVVCTTNSDVTVTIALVSLGFLADDALVVVAFAMMFSVVVGSKLLVIERSRWR